MRCKSLLPLLAAAAVAGCGSEEGKQTASLPDRNLSLPARTPEVQIASPVELGRAQTQPSRRPLRRARPSSRAVVPTIVPAVLRATSAATLPIVKPSSEAPAEVEAPANDRELPPGKTVTIIPASTGPSVGSEGVEDLPPDTRRPMVVRGGGTCRGRGRGPGIGIAAVPRPRLR